MIQSGRFLDDLAADLLETVFRIATGAAKRDVLILAKNGTNYFANKTINEIHNRNSRQLQVQEYR